MIRVIPVLFGALFTVATAWSLGLLLFRKLALVLHVWEERLLAFVAGSACLSAIMFLLSATRQAHRGILLVLGLATIAYAAYSGVFRQSGKPFPPLPQLWRWVFVVAFAAFTYVGFFNALGPEHSPDGMSYHLSEVLKYQHAHGFARITTDVYSNLSQGIELLYLFAVDFGRYSAASLVHFTFLVVLVFLMVCYGKRIGRPEVGVAAAIFTYASPIVLLDASIAYVDVALAAVLFALFYLLQIWDENRDPKMLVPIGLLAGFGYEVKYTAIVAVPYVAGFIIWKLWRQGKPVLRPVLVVSLIAVACIVPWMAKDWIEVANPVSPLANRLFPNPYVHVSFEEGWRAHLSNYDLTDRSQIPLQITVQGDHVEGFLGPLFLLAPLALLALRFREGRQLLLAAMIFGCTYFSNIGTRFLIPVVPFVSLTLALAIANLPWLLLALVAANAIACWPGMYLTYCSPGAWRVETVPIEAALRRQSEDAYLSQDPDYRMARMIGRVVPAGDRIFANGLGGRSYLPRETLIGYYGAANEAMQDMLWTVIFQGYQPTHILKFDFPEREFRKLRVVLKGSELRDQWSMGEMRIFDGSSELPRDPGWRLTAHPNPWEVQLAFDNSPVTRWRSWQPASAGMYVEVDFPRPQAARSVVVESSSEMINTKIALEGMGSDGQWTTVSDSPVISIHPIRTSLRMA